MLGDDVKIEQRGSLQKFRGQGLGFWFLKSRAGDAHGSSRVRIQHAIGG